MKLISPTVHRDTVAAHGNTSEDDILGALVDAAGSFRDACERVNGAAPTIRKNKMQTAAYNERVVRDVASKNFLQAAQRYDAARAKANAEIEKIERQTFAPTAPKDTAGLMMSSEIRAALLTMDEKRRGEAIATAIAAGDDALVGAVLNASSPLLVGITKEDLEMRRFSWRRKKFGAEMARAEMLGKAMKSLDQVAGAARLFIYDLVDSAAIAEAEESEKAAREALAN